MIFKTLRFRLTIFYSFGVAILLIFFGFLSFYSLKNVLFREVDKSLVNYINSVERILNSRLRSTANVSKNLVIPRVKITELADSIYTLISQEIYEQSILKPKNHFVQVFDPTTDTIIYESDNLGDDDLPIDSTWNKVGNVEIKTIESFKGLTIRLGFYHSTNYSIAIASPLKETMLTLNSLFEIFTLLIPGTLLILIFGGWYIANRSLKPIDEITKTTQVITTKHLNKRIKLSKNDDEIGRLILTLNDMIDRLEKSFDKVQQFSADASHELRTPLTILMGELQIALQKELKTDEFKKIISNAIDEIMILSRIVDDLLTLSKAEVEQIDLNFTVIDLNNILSDLYEDIQIISMKKHIEISLNLKDPVEIFGDKIRIRQLLLNLVENAIKYNVDYGKVNIQLMKDNSNAVIIIEDTGEGIPKENADKIFDRFYRVDKSRTRNGGTGLGLSISKWIIEKHGGTIEFSSEVNKGSVFKVIFPINKKG